MGIKIISTVDGNRTMPLGRYFQLYLKLIASRIRSQMQYRLSFVLDVLGGFGSTGLDLLAVLVIFAQTRSLGGWSLGEVALLYGLSALSFAVHELFQGADDNDVFASYIQRGLFDQMLMRPLPTPCQMLTEYFILRRFGRLTQGALALALGITLAQPHWTLVKLFYLPLVIAGGALFFMAISIAGCTLCFWTVQSTEVVNIFTYGGTTMLQYPLDIYQQWMQRFFVYVLPMAFINYYPALFFLDRPDPFNLPAFVPFLAPLVCLAVFALSLRVWRWGIEHYTSTGS